MMRIIVISIEIFDKLFMKIRGVINETSRSKIKNKMAIIKKLVENGTFRMVFSLNPHSKFMFIILWFFFILILTSEVMISMRFEIIRIMIIIFIILINSLSF